MSPRNHQPIDGDFTPFRDRILFPWQAKPEAQSSCEESLQFPHAIRLKLECHNSAQVTPAQSFVHRYVSMLQSATGLESRKGFQPRSLSFVSTPECRQDVARAAVYLYLNSKLFQMCLFFVLGFDMWRGSAVGDQSIVNSMATLQPIFRSGAS